MTNRLIAATASAAKVTMVRGNVLPVKMPEPLFDVDCGVCVVELGLVGG